MNLGPQLQQELAGRHEGRADADDLLIALHGVFRPGPGILGILDHEFRVLV